MAHSPQLSTSLDDQSDEVNNKRDAQQGLRTYHQTATVLFAALKFKHLLLKRSSSGTPTAAQALAPRIEFADLSMGAVLGKGAYGIVHAATLRGSGQAVAVKMLLPEQASNRLAIADLRAEAMLLSQLRHPNVMTALHIGTHPDGRFLMVTSRLTPLTPQLPKPIDQVGLWARRSQVKAWPLARALKLGVHLGRALRYLHDEALPQHVLLHRDVKPDNLGLTPDDELVLFDFGLAKMCAREPRDGAPGPKHTGQTGSLRYMAPEVALEQPYDEAADVYSWAIVTWQLCARDAPFQQMSVAGFRDAVARGGARPPLPSRAWPAPLCTALAACWAADARQRPRLAEALPPLEALLAQLGAQADGTPAKQQPTKAGKAGSKASKKGKSAFCCFGAAADVEEPPSKAAGDTLGDTVVSPSPMSQRMLE